jgi:hypothetical protein
MILYIFKYHYVSVKKNSSGKREKNRKIWMQVLKFNSKRLAIKF